MVDFYVFQCNSKPKLNYENKNDKKFKVVLRRFFLQISKFIFLTLTRKYAFSTYSTDFQLTLLIELVSLVNLKKVQKYKIIVYFFENPIDVDLIVSKRKSISFFKGLYPKHYRPEIYFNSILHFQYWYCIYSCQLDEYL